MAWDDRGSPLVEAFAESVEYHPASGVARTIDAAVIRQEPDPILGAPRVSSPLFRVVVKNHATLGIAVASLKLRGDTLTIAERLGGTGVARPILRLVSQDAGALEVEC